MKTLITIFIFIIIGLSSALAQITQTIRGEIKDDDTQLPLIGVHVKVLKGDTLFGAVTDLDGRFTVNDVPIGRVSVHVSFLGYEPVIYQGLFLTASKQLVLNVRMIESVEQLKAVTIEGNKREAVAINEMAVLSARSFTVEETGRYAGSFGDPARAVSGFAGVVGSTDGNNDIIVRGNSPRHIHWRIEGHEAPNPNHFATEGATGGPISLLNANMLANSDFFSGAFPSSYGNALSGVFDVNLRRGNNEKRESAIGFSALGLEANSEGPINKEKGSSYNVNYRYSSLALLTDVGIVDFGGVPKYQDGAFKLHFPTKKAGVFSFYGIGGISGIDEVDRDSNDVIQSNGHAYNKLGVLGATHVISIGKNGYIKSGIAISSTLEEWEYEERVANTMRIEDVERFNNNYLRSYVSYNHKFSAKHKLSTRITHSEALYDYNSNWYSEVTNQLESVTKEKGQSNYTQANATWKYRPNEKWTFIPGIHFMHFAYTGEVVTEPRLAVKYNVTKRQNFSLAGGMHSRMEPLITYFSETFVPGSIVRYRPNTKLQMNKAIHAVAGYGIHLASGWHVKTEAYFQYLYDIPKGVGLDNNFSTLNSFGYAGNTKLINEGLGRNYGLELTLDKPLTNGFYLLATASLYQSEFSNDSGTTWQQTRFNGNYVFNVMAGKEWMVGKKKGKTNVVGVNLTSSVIGGMRYRDIDLAASRSAGTTVYYSDFFDAKSDDLLKQNLSAYYRFNRKKTSHEFKIDVQNILNHTPAVAVYYDPQTDNIESYEGLGLLPNIVYTMRF